MNYEAMKVRHWRIVFERKENGIFWNRYVPFMHFNHCELMGRDAYGWLMVKPVYASVRIFMLAAPKELAPEDWIPQDENKKVLVAKHHKMKRPRVFYYAPWSCVEVCKAHLNISSWWIITPDQLYIYVEKKGKTPAIWTIKNVVLSAYVIIMAILTMPFVKAYRALRKLL